MPALRLGEKIVLFIHIPKTAGTSIRTWLSEAGTEGFYAKHRPDTMNLVPQHFHGALLNTMFPQGFFDYSFCVTRNPYARVLSEYNYRITRPGLRRRLMPKPGFERWLSKTFARYNRDPFIYSNHIRPQHEFMIDGTEFFRLEEGIGPLQRRLAEETGVTLPASIPHENKSASRASGITEAAAAQIRAFYAQDFERFGYDPESWRNL